MKGVTGSLGFRLITASFLVVSVFITIAGISVYKISQDSIKVGSMEMVSGMADDVRLRVAKEESIESISDALMAMKIKKTGSVWLMDRKGLLLFNPDPLYREEYVKTGKELGNVVISLQYASPRAPGTGSYREKLVDIIGKYEEGFGTYQQFGETKVIAFKVLKDRGWLIGVDEPVATAFSELNRIRRYILYTGLISAVLILAFTWLAIRIIVKPYYREVEELNERLQQANLQLTESNSLLEVSNKKLTALYEISIHMQETLSLQDILDLIVGGAQEVLQVDRINIMLPNKEGTMLECRAAYGAGNIPLSEIAVPLSSKGGALAAAFKRGHVVRVSAGEHLPPNLKLDSPYSEHPFLRSSAFVVLPMVVKNRSVGVIAIDNKVSKAPISDDMVTLIQIFANQAAVAVDNARLYEELKRNLEELDSRVDQLSIVNQISNTMQKMVKKKEMLGFILRGIKESMGFDILCISLTDKVEDVIHGEVGVGTPEQKLLTVAVPLADEDNVMAAAVSRGTPAIYATHKQVDFLDALAVSMDEAGLKEGAPPEGATLAVAVLPVWVLDDVVGVIAAARVRKNAAVTKREMELLMLFANTAGLAVERAQLYEKLQEDIGSLEITDHVTKLFTFKYGQQRLREEMIRARESGRPLTVVMTGIDNFKEYNDRSGQELGDRTLATIARMVMGAFTENDLTFRYGGRLFCTLLPGKSLKEAKPLAEKLGETVQVAFFPGPDGKEDQKLTISLGLFEFHNQSSIQSSSDLFKMAVAYLHRAEAAGGGRTLSE